MNEARALYRKALDQIAAGEVDEALATLHAVDALVPGDTAVLQKFAEIALARGDHAGAEDFYRQAHETAPQSAMFRTLYGHLRLFRGDYAGGFPLFDAWRVGASQNHSDAIDPNIPRWTGQPLTGKRLLVWCEEGFGDQIMYARFAPELARRAGSVVWGAGAPMVRLLQKGLGLEVVPKGVGASVPGVVDFVIPSSSLPAVLMPEMKSPSPEPYLRATAHPLPDGVRIGVKVSGAPGHTSDALRSLDRASAERLLGLNGAIDLSPEATGARDFYDTAQVIMGLDLVISVDTSVAHLAGALGKPVWILLPTGPGLDWRWLRDGEASPWYGSARLFRQSAPGDWAAVTERVIAALQSEI